MVAANAIANVQKTKSGFIGATEVAAAASLNRNATKAEIRHTKREAGLDRAQHTPIDCSTVRPLHRSPPPACALLAEAICSADASFSPPIGPAVRRVVTKESVRCRGCQLPPRWCICAAHRAITCPLEIDVLMHHREQFRPSSTGNLIRRLIPASRHHLWRRERRMTRHDVAVPGRELWILHPHGEPPPGELRADEVQVVLLDGSWREASAMAQEVSEWGRLIGLPMQGASRYWLRAQADRERFSTVEALQFLLNHFGLTEVAEEVRRQFELHVYANLRARGHKEQALRFLADSPAATAFANLIAQLDVRRPR
jgi:DTW domain-containing protein YfiP